MYKPIAVEPIPPAKLAAVRQAYKEVCHRFLDAAADNPFFEYVQSSIANDAALDRHIRAFEIYAPYLRPGMRVLDWGCRHAPDACMLRCLHPELELHGCDFNASDFTTFHEFAGLSFSRLTHQYQLPYADGTFDAVLSSGVLEHVGFEHESILELWRVLRNDGLLIVTFLPNRYSLTENVSRFIGSFDGHNRLYGIRQARNVFLKCGFVVESAGCHQVFPTFAKGVKSRRALNTVANMGARLNRVAERVPVLRALAANIFLVLRRVRHM